MNTLEVLEKQTAREDPQAWRIVQKNIRCDADIMDGLPVFAGTRVPVYIVLENIAEGIPPEEILKAYPTLGTEQIRASLHFSRLLASLH